MREVALSLLILFGSSPAHAENWQETRRNIDYDPDSIRYSAARDALVVRKRYRMPNQEVILLVMVSCSRLERWDKGESEAAGWGPRRGLPSEDVAIYRDRVCAQARRGALPAYEGPLPPA